MKLSAEHAGRLEALFDEAIELEPAARPAFLDQACGDDPELRRDVEALLAAFDTRAADVRRFFDALPLAQPARGASDPHRLVGQRISHYQVQAYIGGGGMGMVYQAENTRLRRAVALKFLPPELMRDAEARARFLREAKAASALDHPHICTIYDINETDEGQLFIAMAYYAGETLKAKIQRGPLPVEKALDYAAQIARGLERAHAAGIIHRDVKPANVMVTDEGQVKVLDFGIAKVTGVDLTKTGVTQGTVAYISPEQVRGEAVDHRADVWSLGVVLYEMLTGKRPFRGERPQAVIYSILNEEPELLLALRPEVPEAVAALVYSALSKAPPDRPASMGAMEAALTTLQPAARSRTPGARSRWRWTGAVAVLLAALAGTAYFLGGRSPETLTFRLGQTTQATRAAGTEFHPALSPDGKLVAYVAGPERNTRLFVRQVTGGRPLALTADLPGTHEWPRWSPGGDRIAFQSGGEIYVIPALGGIPRRVVAEPSNVPQWTENVNGLAWSPDGRQVAYSRGGTIYVRALDEAAPSVLVEDDVALHSLDWSPDGSRLAYVSGSIGFVFLGNAASSSLWVVPIQGGAPVRVTEPEHVDMSPVWTPDGQHLLFISDRDGSRDVYQMALSETGAPVGSPARLTTGLYAHTIHLAPDGSRLAYTVYTKRHNIWSIPIPDDGPISVAEAEPVTTGNQDIASLSISPDGRWLAFDSNRSGNPDIYKMPVAGGEPEQLTTNPAQDFQPRWSPDGREIVFHSHRTGNGDLYVMSAEEGALHQVIDDSTHESDADWSPDGRKLLFRRDVAGRQELYIIARGNDTSEWGSPVLLNLGEGDVPVASWSPDGDLIAYIWDPPGFYNRSIRVIPPEGGPPRVLVQDPVPVVPRPEALAWAPNGQTVYYKSFDHTESRASLWSVPADGGTPRLLIEFDDPDRASPQSEFATDGERFFFTITERESDIWVAEVFTEH